MVWVIGFLLIVLVAVLGVGLFSLLKGGEFNKKHGNQLMMMRVGVQAVIVLLLGVMFMLSGRG